MTLIWIAFFDQTDRHSVGTEDEIDIVRAQSREFCISHVDVIDDSFDIAARTGFAVAVGLLLVAALVSAVMLGRDA